MKWMRGQFPTLAAVFVWWRDSLTWGGKTITCVLLLGMTRLSSLDSPLLLLCSAQLSLLLVAGMIGYWFRPQLTIRVTAPEAVHVGEPFELLICVANCLSQPAYDLAVDLVDAPESWDIVAGDRGVPALAAHCSIHVPVTVCPTRRGLFELPRVRATTTFPLNFMRFGRQHHVAGELIVMPSFRPLAAFAPGQVALKYSGRNLHDLLVTGHAGDYCGSREYLPGMPVRRWDYSKWARLGRPVVREFAEPVEPIAGIVIDFVIPSATRNLGERGPTTPFEATLSLAAALSEALTARGYCLAFLATAGHLQDLSNVALSDQYLTVMRSLAMQTPSADRGTLHRLCRFDDWPVGPVTVFLLVHGWDTMSDRFCQQVLQRGCELRRVFIQSQLAGQIEPRPEDTWTSLDDIAAGRVELT